MARKRKITVSSNIGNKNSSANAESHAKVNVDDKITNSSISGNVNVEIGASAEKSTSGKIINGIEGNIGVSANVDVGINAGVEVNGNAGWDGKDAEVEVKANVEDHTKAGINIGKINIKAEGEAHTCAYAEAHAGAEGLVTVGKHSIDVGAMEGAGVGVDARGSAKVGNISTDVSTGVSAGMQICIEGEGHAIFKNDVISIDASGEAAVLLGINMDINVNIDTNPITNTAKKIGNKTKKAVSGTAKKTVDTAKKTVSGVKKKAKKLKFW